jgi:nucleotide-binding universal stress UspA family protein
VYTHILVPTDFSEAAHQAVRYALEEATVHQAALTLVHVLHHHPKTEVYDVTGDPERLPGLRAALVAFDPGFDPAAGTRLPPLQRPAAVTVHRDDAAETLTRLHYLIPRSFTGHWNAEVVTGDPVGAILRLARQREVGLIVMGTHGRTGLRHVLLGSVAETVVRRAPCPVLVTR